jgi:hypothetical protein
MVGDWVIVPGSDGDLIAKKTAELKSDCLQLTEGQLGGMLQSAPRTESHHQLQTVAADVAAQDAAAEPVGF